MVAVVAERRRAGVRAAATRRRQERGRGRGQRQSPPPLIPQGRLGGGAGYGAAATCSRRWSRARRKAQQFWHKRARRSLGSNGHAHASRAQRWTRRSMEAQNDGSSKRLQAGWRKLCTRAPVVSLCNKLDKARVSVEVRVARARGSTQERGRSALRPTTRTRRLVLRARESGSGERR